MNRWALSCTWSCIKRPEPYLLALSDIDSPSNPELVLGCLWLFQFLHLYRKDRPGSLWAPLGVRELHAALASTSSLTLAPWSLVHAHPAVRLTSDPKEKEVGFPHVGPRPSWGIQGSGRQAPNPQLPLKKRGCHSLLCKPVFGMV